MGLIEIPYTKLFVLYVVYSNHQKILANIISNNNRMAGSYFLSTYNVQTTLTYTNKYGTYLLAWEIYKFLKKNVMYASRCNNLLQYILGEADEKAWRISEPPGCSRGTTGLMSKDLKLSSWSKGIEPFYLHFSLWMWVTWEGMCPWTRQLSSTKALKEFRLLMSILRQHFQQL